MRECWNRQTGAFEGRVKKFVWVQVPSLAPGNTWRRFACEIKSKLFSFTLAFLAFRSLLLFVSGSTWRQFACEAKSKLFSFTLAFLAFRSLLLFVSCWITIRDLVFCAYPFLKSVIVLSNSLFFFTPKILYKAFLLVF